MQKEEFIDLLKKHECDFQKYCTLRDSMIFSNKIIDTKCTSCNEYTHSLKNCPCLHLNLNPYLVIGKYNYSRS